MSINYFHATNGTAFYLTLPGCASPSGFKFGVVPERLHERCRSTGEPIAYVNRLPATVNGSAPHDRVHLTIGQGIELDGLLYALLPAPNGNLQLVPV